MLPVIQTLAGHHTDGKGRRVGASGGSWKLRLSQAKRSGAKDKFVRNRTPERGLHAYSHKVPCRNTSETEDGHQSRDLRSKAGEVPRTSRQYPIASTYGAIARLLDRSQRKYCLAKSHDGGADAFLARPSRAVGDAVIRAAADSRAQTGGESGKTPCRARPPVKATATA